VDLDLQREKVRSLFIDLFTDFLRDVLVKFVLDKLLDGQVNVGVYLLLDLREDYGLAFDAVKRTPLTLFRKVLKDFIIEGLLQQSCQTTTSALCGPGQTVLTSNLITF
jgi:hypothetical protein